MWDRKLRKRCWESVGGLCGTCLCIWVGNTCTDRETGGEGTCSRTTTGFGEYAERSEMIELRDTIGRDWNDEILEKGR